ncbi:MAG: hypothetical protein V3V68_05070 [Nitrosomonadaceae bacterium]
MKRYIIYNYDTDKLVSTTAYADYYDAVDMTDQLDNAIIIAFCVEDK